ncbi:transcription factor PAP1 [Trichoderma gamsii]|uniref:Transcription factor PAP1 n=1 Tax=Trichoderma gamsii TaxID=398673 RepID=A0A2P4ZGH5_9HYPO|nr:transcription factor PAP1 [Trichoderma gamsii]PON23367.1 transcription factor PAP1 [Trichoderma gamsii]
MQTPSASISSWDETQFLIDMQGPMNMTYTEAYEEVMQCFLPTAQTGLTPHSPICDSPAESFTTQRFDMLSESSADMSNQSYSASSSRSQSPATSKLKSLDLTAVRKLSKRQKNREAQRAYRERKEKLLQTLVEKVEKLEAAYSVVKDERDQLQRRLDNLTNPTGLVKDNVLNFDDQFGNMSEFQFNNFLFSNLPRQHTILPLS